MRELERDTPPTPLDPLLIVGRGRVGGSLTRAAGAAGLDVHLCSADEADPAEARAMLLCVPDEAIAAVCARLGPGGPPLIGHVSGAATLEVLASAADSGRETFSLHPLQSFPDERTAVEGTPAAVAGSTASALEYARSLAENLGLRPFEVPEQSRAAYHAAASIASNLLVALEESAAELLSDAGVENARELLAPLVLRTAANWSERGGAALTGPIARGDSATVERHRAAIAETAPELLATYDALAERARRVAAEVPA